MIVEMERKLNPLWFMRRLRGNDEYCTLSSAQYWDWLVYIDVSLAIDKVIVWPLIGRLPNRVGNSSHERTLFLPTPRDEWSVRCPLHVCFRREYAVNGADRQIIHARMVSPFPRRRYHRHFRKAKEPAKVQTANGEIELSTVIDVAIMVNGNIMVLF